MKDHRDLIQAYDLGHIEEHSPGLIHWHPNGQKVIKKLKEKIISLHEKYNYEEVSSPILLHKSLWEKSGHWDKYQSNMFVAEGGLNSVEKGQFAVKPMSCPGQISIFNHKPKSYRQMPVKLFEFGHVHRNEPSGSLSGWMRLRGFVQDDSHVFAQYDQIEMVISSFVEMVEYMYKLFGFEQWKWRLSLRPEKRSGSDEIWDMAENSLRNACKNLGIEFEEAEGEGAFYGPKLEASLMDRMGRWWQCGVAQVDFVLPEKFELSYKDQSNNSSPVFLIHHAILGSLERWISIVMEHLGQLPEWLHPNPIVLLPISKHQQDYVYEISKKLKEDKIDHMVLDEGSLQSRIKIADNLEIPYRWVFGKKEVESELISVKKFHQEQELIDYYKAIKKI